MIPLIAYRSEFDLVRRVIDENPWMTLVSATPDGLVASHYAVLLDEGEVGLGIEALHHHDGAARALDGSDGEVVTDIQAEMLIALLTDALEGAN